MSVFSEAFQKVELTKARKDTVISSSIKGKDHFHQYHDLCYTYYTYYTSKDKINRRLKRINEQSVDGSSAKRLNQSSVSMFNFKTNCFLCGQYCEVIPNPESLGRWEKNCGILSQTADLRTSKKSFK